MGDDLLEINDPKWERCIAFVLSHEGGLQKRTDDPGNWTGGRVGMGKLVGTNFGISAASFPLVDIENLTIEEAKTIYRNNYYIAVSCHKMPYPLALVVFDAAVNQGLGWATRQLQNLLGVVTDGDIGPKTQEAIALSFGKKIVRSFIVRRLIRYAFIQNQAWLPVWFERMLELTEEVMRPDLYPE